ncbi:hypothetical protein E4U61_002128 [Claviceps capensis]|nr:hypothetical protein E4U61_002128 [Claviceps capensis]
MASVTPPVMHSLPICPASDASSAPPLPIRMSRTANLTQLKEAADNVPSQRRSITLQRKLAQVPITSVAFFTTPSGIRFFLAGQDGELAIYPDAQPPPQSPLFTLPIFEDQPIHGIRVQGPRLLLWGASQIALLDGESLTEDHPPVLLATTTAPDWIYDAALSPFCVDDAVLATAHNEVVVLRYHASNNPGEQGTVVLGNVASPSRPMLYAAHLLWESASRVLIAAGTVFGDILVWRYSIAEDEHAMAFVLRGHEGSIYGVDVSAPLVLRDGTRRRLLASCSDDRTIRIWDISLDGDEAKAEAAVAVAASTHEGTQCVEAQDTGFKAAQTYDALQADSGEGEARPVAVGMGHASRIWGVRFALDSSEAECVLDGDALCVYSFGEDSTTQRWKLSLEPREASTMDHLMGQLTHQHTYALHHGKHIWARALDVHAQGGVEILTGGADGKISAIREQALHGDGVQSFGPVFMALDVSDALGQGAGKGDSFSSRETFSRYDFLSEDQMLAITNAGRLFVGDLLARTWAEVIVEDDENIVQDLKRCHVLRTTHGHDGAAVIGTTNGKVYYFHRHQQHQVQDSGHDRDQFTQYRLVCAAEVPGRITEINHLSSSDQQLISILVHIHGSSSSHLLSLTPFGEVVERELLTGLDARFVAVSATRLDDLIILGSRHGYIALLTRHEDHTWQPVLEAATRSRDAITAIVPLPTATKNHHQITTTPSCPYILTTSRDSKYRIYHINQTPHSPHSTPSLTLIHETSPPFGPMIEGAWFTTSTSTLELILYGFRSKDFIIWNESTGEELATINCGGAHRTFRLQHDPRAEPHRYRFAYTRTSKLCISSQVDVPCRTVRRGTHGREVRALSANKRFVASGAEDTSIRIWECMPTGEGAGVGRRELGGGATMRNMACIKAHVTGLQKLRWFGDEYLFSSAGNEEFFAWRVRRLGDGSAYAGLAVMCEGVFTEKSPVGDLRILDFDVSWVGGPEGQGRMVVTLAFSNSSLKTYEYECGGGSGSGSGSFRLLAEGRYTGACITQLRHLGFWDGASEEDVGESDGSVNGHGNGTELHVLTASTDGHLALWRGAYLDGEAGTQRYSLEAAYAVHQSSIKSLDMSREGIQIRVVTGGDDNALGYVQIAEMQSGTGTERRTSYGFVSRAIIRKAHTAAVNGVALLPVGHHRRQLDDQGPEDTLAVSVSNDQRVKVWRISAHEARDVRVSLAACMSSGVADPGDVAIICPGPGQESQIVLGGVGVEVWRVQHADAQRDDML